MDEVILASLEDPFTYLENIFFKTCSITVLLTDTMAKMWFWSQSLNLGNILTNLTMDMSKMIPKDISPNTDHNSVGIPVCDRQQCHI